MRTIEPSDATHHPRPRHTLIQESATMRSFIGNVYSHGKRSFDLPGSAANVKSRKKSVIGVCVLAVIFFLLPFDSHRLQVTSSSSSETAVIRTDFPSETRNSASEAFRAAPASVSNASVNDGDTESAPASGRESETVNEFETASVDDDIIQGKPGTCLKHVLYDKPVKTGSTAISFAIREFLALRNEKDKSCGGIGPLSCVERAKSICNGTVEEKDHFSILGHLKFGGRELAECLRPNFYVVTSVREPYQRRKSSYLWNRTVNGTHFNIPHTASFKEFMNRMPRCQLYHYYDGRGSHCDTGMPLEDRIEDIVSRVDEVIDIYDEPAGPLHKLIADFLKRENESIKLDKKDYLEDFDRDTLKEEQLLYDRLRTKRSEPPNKDRTLC